MSGILELLSGSSPYGVVVIMLVVALAAMALMCALERKLRRGRKTDVERLFEAARRLNTSEFQVFRIAGGTWNVPEEGIREDFKRYLLQGEIPHYVRHYLRAGGHGDENR